MSRPRAAAAGAQRSVRPSDRAARGRGGAGGSPRLLIALVVALLLLTSAGPVATTGHRATTALPFGAPPRAAADRGGPLAGSACAPHTQALSLLPEPIGLLPPLLHSLAAPCAIGSDVATVSLLSSGASSASRVAVALTLPPAASTPAQEFLASSVSLWVTGVSCSFHAVSVLSVDLLPPGSAYAAGGSSWSVMAPVWDLVPAGSCDPLCSNDTALFTVLGVPSCEQDASLLSISRAATGAFAPGDALVLTFVAGGAGAGPLTVFLNDSTNPGDSLSWSYPASAMRAGAALAASTGSANASGGWTGAGPLSWSLVDCASSLPGGPAVNCSSYQPPASGPSPFPRLDRATYWEGSGLGYAGSYSAATLLSSSGGCAGDARAYDCTNFLAGGGTYPRLELRGAQGAAWLELSNTAGGNATAASWSFPALGASAPFNLEASGDPSGSNSSGFYQLLARETSFSGVGSVRFTVDWCTHSGTPSLSTSLGAPFGPGSHVQDGNWSESGSTNGFTGTLRGWVSPVDRNAQTGGPAYVNISIGSGSPSCVDAAPPLPVIVLGPQAIRASAYLLNWTEPATAPVIGYNVNLTPSSGRVFVNLSLANVTSVAVNVAPMIGYSLVVSARGPSGLLASSPVVPLPPTAGALAVGWPTIPGTVGAGAPLSVQLSLTGGAAPYQVSLDPGDGSPNLTAVTAGSPSWELTYAGVAGTVLLSASVTDANGSVLTSRAPMVLQVLGTPRSVVAVALGTGAGVSLSWLPPPANEDVGAYLVWFTQNSTLAPWLSLAELGPGVAPMGLFEESVPGGNVTAVVPAADGSPVYLQIVAVNASGEGGLPALRCIPSPSTACPLGAPVLVATPEPLLILGLVLTPPGGPAPLHLSALASASAGSGEAITSATFRFSSGLVAPAAVVPQSGQFVLGLPMPVTIQQLGLGSVTLVVNDSGGESTSLSAQYFVGAGAPLRVSVSGPSGPVWNGSLVNLSASAEGGSGSYAFSWSFGDGSTSSGASTSTEYPAPGVYSVQVNVADTMTGGTGNASIAVQVLRPLALTLSAASAGDPVELFANVTGGDGSPTVSWTFDDGAGATGAAVNHSFSGTGTHHATAVASELGRTVSARLSFSIPTRPAAAATFSGTTLAEGLLPGIVIGALLTAVILRRRTMSEPRAEPPERPPRRD